MPGGGGSSCFVSCRGLLCAPPCPALRPPQGFTKPAVAPAHLTVAMLRPYALDLVLEVALTHERLQRAAGPYHTELSEAVITGRLRPWLGWGLIWRFFFEPRTSGRAYPVRWRRSAPLRAAAPLQRWGGGASGCHPPQDCWRRSSSATCSAVRRWTSARQPVHKPEPPPPLACVWC